MREVHIIEKRKIKPKMLKVAAYARVSSDKDAMVHSLAAQISYYQRTIKSHAGWEFTGVFADEGLTGTKEERPNFQRLLDKCRKHEVDLILTKSISRFARNTVTLLETVRELKALGIAVEFEEQNINTLSSDGEVMLTILASYAQEESKSASDNQKWRIHKDFEQGKVWGIRMLGYKRNADGVLEIDRDEAEIVRYIFHCYLSGMGKNAIANELNENHVPTKNSCEWTPESVFRILRNEKYTGDLMLQKFYSENHLTKRKMKNEGELPKIYVEDAHEPIISREIFEMVQERMKKQADSFSSEKSHSARYPFSGMIQCCGCRKNYRRKTTPTGIVWICSTYNSKGKRFCPKAKQISENTLMKVCCEVLGIEKFDEKLFEERVRQIKVPEPNQLIFCMADGEEITASWKDRSRSESWTPERRKLCQKSQQFLQQNAGQQAK